MQFQYHAEHAVVITTLSTFKEFKLGSSIGDYTRSSYQEKM